MQPPHLASEAGLHQRSWTPGERRHVMRGFLGRTLIAIEPLLCTVVFAVFTLLSLTLMPPEFSAVAAGTPKPMLTLSNILAPLFGATSCIFAVYTVAVLRRPVAALFSTFGPIYVVDGYLRYEHRADGQATVSYIAVMDEAHTVLREWILPKRPGIPDGRYPALVEFSAYGGIIRVDGKGLEHLKPLLAPFGVGTFAAENRTGDV